MRLSTGRRHDPSPAELRAEHILLRRLDEATRRWEEARAAHEAAAMERARIMGSLVALPHWSWRMLGETVGTTRQAAAEFVRRYGPTSGERARTLRVQAARQRAKMAGRQARKRKGG